MVLIIPYLFGYEQITANDPIDHKNTNLNVKLTRHRNSVPNCHNNYLTKTGLTTTAVNLTLVTFYNKGRCQMKDVKKCVNNSPCLV